MIQMAKENPGNSYLVMTNKDVAGLIPKKYNLKWWEDMHGEAAHMTYRVHIGDVFDKCGGQHGCHPTSGFFQIYSRQSSFPYAVQPEIEYEVKDQPQYDYVISAMSKANGVRMWPIDEWKKLLPQLNGSICMVGAKDEDHPFEGIDYFCGHPLQDVAAVLKKARCVITIDNGIGRLAHAVGCNHVLLLSTAVGEIWGSYPGAHTIYSPPKEFGVDRVLATVRNVF
jgi:ADP-heptose:LPS heptosyltransferase